jgi:hypothetical protein
MTENGSKDWIATRTRKRMREETKIMDGRRRSEAGPPLSDNQGGHARK